MSKFLSDRKSLPVLMSILGTTVVLLMLCSAYFQFHYSDTCPILEEKEVGRTYPLNVHGRIVYLTQTEKCRLNALEGITVAFGLSFCALGLLRPKQAY